MADENIDHLDIADKIIVPANALSFGILPYYRVHDVGRENIEYNADATHTHTYARARARISVRTSADTMGRNKSIRDK